MNGAGVRISNSAKHIGLVLFVLLILGLIGSGILDSRASTPLVTATPGATPAFCQGVYRDDTSTGNNDIETYPCRPDWPETGPEHSYRLDTRASQALTLTLSHAPDLDLDLDIFLLENGELDQCHAADATLHIDVLPPGEHLIVVDGFSGSMGPYVLNVDCIEPPLATPTPTDTPFPTSTATTTVQPTPTPTPTATATRSKLTYQSYLPAQRQGYPRPTPQPTTLILQTGLDNYDGIDDSYVDAWDISANYAKLDRLALRQPDIMAPVIRVQLDQIPADAHIVDATLSLWTLSRTNDNPATVGAYRLNRLWDVTEVTWQRPLPELLWFSAGANGTPQDREVAPDDTQQVSGIQNWYHWHITNSVRTWIAKPEQNYGLVLKAFDDPRVYYAFASAEYNNPGARPKLTITYWTPPTSLLGSN